MKEFTYTIKDSVGIHARPAGLLVKCASMFKSEILLTKGEKCVDAKKIFSVMTLGAKQGDEVTIVGTDGNQRLTVEELAKTAGSFNYEYVCDITKRVPRVYISTERK